LHPGITYRTRVRAVRNEGRTPITPETMVLSIGPGVTGPDSSLVSTGQEIQISTETTPSLRGAQAAISGGPILVRGGKVVRIPASTSSAYQSRSAFERHPRSAIGWNDANYFLVEVDGRQDESVGMTLRELSGYLLELGCTDAMNLDGGGSATLWYAGRVRNQPCDGTERPVANSVVIVKTDRNTAGR
jgi:exopolysaccharide biosynthesis protein